jgi:hypothetical protein
LTAYHRYRSTVGSLLIVLLVGIVAAATIGTAAARQDASASAADSGGASIAQQAAECNDGINNDPLEDDLIDFAGDGDDDGEPGQQDDGDPDCTDVNDFHEHSTGPPPSAECNDGIDNDEDGLIDFADDGDDDGEPGQEDDGDPDCDSVDDPSEEGPPPTFECNDGIDNDEDGLIDFIDDGDDDGEPGQEDDGDPECDDAEDPTENGGVTTCGTDNGDDGTIHSTFAPEENEDGPISGLVHEADQALVIPLVTADGGVVPEVNCAVVKGILGL